VSYEKKNKLHIIASCALIRNEEGKYLVVKRSKNESVGPGLYTIPGGKTEGNDTVEETLKKEVLEETGLVLMPGKILLVDKSFVRPDGQTAKVLSFLCQAKNTENVKLSEDFTEYKWITFEELRNLPHIGLEPEFLKAKEIFDSGIRVGKMFSKSIKIK
jgi:8-oxo-dGTP diphosphatase